MRLILSFGRHLVSSLMLILLLTGSAGATRMIGAIVTADLPHYRQEQHALEQILRAGGYPAGRLEIFVQTPNSDPMSLRNSIRRAVAAGAELLITYGALATAAAVEEAGDLPILFADVYDPVEPGFVQNLLAPGVNRSGASSRVSLDPLLEKLQNIRSACRILAMYDDRETDSVRQLNDLREAARRQGMHVIPLKAGRNPVQAAIDAAGKVDFLLLTTAVSIEQNLDDIIAAATAVKLPVIATTFGAGQKGALFTYAGHPNDQGKLVAVHALQVLAGQKAYMLPVRTPKKAYLVLNLQVADRLGLALPEEATKNLDKVLR
ncbi:putative ABC transport system substrate-binding protein [Geothermobacter ehrlichii]|uniref:Putative ABC transport system substrate-binding protein n=1 Tax=Geothermobacter ehrlichii TaxID=213224 RepID=A0A5D3WJR1_9BACT|nr:ABC transporter substrate-binding protein [Geothermobacter ehrlichii]TYO98541.1 putative ABC transport system substrate-binding protein [Geothermobacter ehrlichii]